MKKTPIFIHLPKTGGLSITDQLDKYFPGYSRNSCSHRQVSKLGILDKKNKFTFAITRNPFDRLVSAWAYLINGGGNHIDEEFGKTLPKDFNKFVKLLTKWDLDNLPWPRGLHLRTMDYWLDSKVDYIGRYEQLQLSYKHICKKCGIPYSVLPETNKSRHKHYTKYYNNESISIVSKLYKIDLDRFNYKYNDE